VVPKPEAWQVWRGEGPADEAALKTMLAPLVIAERITGTHWSGPRFFGWRKRALLRARLGRPMTRPATNKIFYKSFNLSPN
jgi:hypothetical protein